MPLIRIESLDDPRILAYRDLPRSKLPRRAGLFIAEGRLLVERLLASDFETESILVESRQWPAIEPLVPATTPVYQIPAGMVEQIVGYNFHRGIIACGRRKQVQSAFTWPRTSRATVVVCIRVHDPENLGGIIRNCAAFGVTAVILSPQCCDPFSRRVLRVSMGSVLRVPIVESVSLESELEKLKAADFQFTATVLDPAVTPIHRFRRAARQALLLGNEAHGLESAWIERCDQQVTIPIYHGVDSLNVAVASGICLYQLSGSLSFPDGPCRHPASDSP